MSNDLAEHRKKHEREEAFQKALNEDEAPVGCQKVTFICPDCSGVMSLIIDGDGKILKTINLRHRT